MDEVGVLGAIIAIIFSPILWYWLFGEPGNGGAPEPPPDLFVANLSIAADQVIYVTLANQQGEIVRREPINQTGHYYLRTVVDGELRTYSLERAA